MACLLLLMADNNRFGLLKTEHDNNFLMGEQVYPIDVLQDKRLMADFVLAAGAAKHRQKLTKLTDVAFVETTDQEWHTWC